MEKFPDPEKSAPDFFRKTNLRDIPHSGQLYEPIIVPYRFVSFPIIMVVKDIAIILQAVSLFFLMQLSKFDARYL